MNTVHGALFALPPLIESRTTDIAVFQAPLMRVVTGDEETDALLWLRELVRTGRPELIAKALEALRRLSTPLAKLEKKYIQHLISRNPGNVFATFDSMGLDDLAAEAQKATKNASLAAEARARFGDQLFEMTPAEAYCQEVLKGLIPTEGATYGGDDLDKDEAAKHFAADPSALPASLSDCLRELKFWERLYTLRCAVDRGCGDDLAEVYARKDFVFGLLATIPPTSEDEAMSVFEFLGSSDQMDRDETPAILRNLIKGPTLAEMQA